MTAVHYRCNWLSAIAQFRILLSDGDTKGEIFIELEDMPHYIRQLVSPLKVGPITEDLLIFQITRLREYLELVYEQTVPFVKRATEVGPRFDEYPAQYMLPCSSCTPIHGFSFPSEMISSDLCSLCMYEKSMSAGGSKFDNDSTRRLQYMTALYLTYKVLKSKGKI